MPDAIPDTAADLLAPLFAPLTSLRGVGPQLATHLARATGGTRVVDLLFHLPESYLDRRDRPTIRDGVAGQVATLAVDVVRIDGPLNDRQPWRVVVRDATGFGELVYFRRKPPRELAPGASVLVSGKLDRFQERLTIAHPAHVLPAGEASRLPGVEPVWRLTSGLFPGQMRLAVGRALAALPEFPEWHDAALLRREAWPGFGEALRALHVPAEWPGPAAGRRLAYDELLASQVALAWLRQRARVQPGRSLTGDGALRAAAIARFGHEPTASQAAVLAEIDADLAAPARMVRLLQGDVGAGKTFVAALAMLRAVEAGAQAALMAPTETLARQHHRTLSRICPVPVALLTGSVKAAARQNVLAALMTGRVKLVVGTHALFQEKVAFRDLGLAVIDEQHRFGVGQRLSLGAKGDSVDVLVMTATPIPRTLLLTHWGEMAVSRIVERPAGRPQVRTTMHALGQLDAVEEAVGRAVERGEQVFWVCPLVEGEEEADVAAAHGRHDALRRRFGSQVGLAHGKMPADLREAALARFAAGRTRVLVATTVIEVGVDVPGASVMVVERAERFGLAQLHQLRGRVGRAGQASYCLLLHGELTEVARRRLVLLRDTEDGFAIADEDFRIRGGGELLGRRQSGQPDWRLADPVEHEGLLQMARADAALLLERDPKLVTPRGRAVRLLLRLFERGEALRTLGAG